LALSTCKCQEAAEWYKAAVLREFSAGCVLVRRLRGRWVFAAIRPQGKPEGTWALPKGLIDAGESAVETALREVEEETGARGEVVRKLADTRYVYTARWRGGERVFKVVSFFLVRWTGGRLGAISDEMRREVAEARWLPLDEAATLLAYKGEREIAEKARAAVAESAL
jgi:8-oxo-dGTP pyrophosphatase MutT (NUDIX family)